MRLITISGLDGSGKSTQIELLKSYLESHGKKVFYFHAIQFSLANILKNQYYKLLHMQRFVVLDNDAEKSVTKANWLQIISRRIFLMIDILRFKLLRNKLRNENYDYILSDRYFYDSIINIEYLKSNSLPLEKGELRRDLKDYKSPLTPLLQRGILAPDVALYLQTNPETIMQRERKPDQGIEYLHAKKLLYDKTAPIWNLKIIDGNKNKEEIFEEIGKTIFNSSNF